MGKELTDIQIEKILNEFDFHESQRIFEVMGYTYFNSDETPTINELRDTARIVLQGAVDNGRIYECGRFLAYNFQGIIGLRLAVLGYDIYKRNN